MTLETGLRKQFMSTIAEFPSQQEYVNLLVDLEWSRSPKAVDVFPLNVYKIPLSVIN